METSEVKKELTNSEINKSLQKNQILQLLQLVRADEVIKKYNGSDKTSQSGNINNDSIIPILSCEEL